MTVKEKPAGSSYLNYLFIWLLGMLAAYYYTSFWIIGDFKAPPSSNFFFFLQLSHSEEFALSKNSAGSIL